MDRRPTPPTMSDKLAGRPLDSRSVRDILLLQAAGVDTAAPQIVDLVARQAAARAEPREAWPAPPEPTTASRPPVVYFIRHGDHVKIGFTAQPVRARMTAMTLPPGAELVAVIPGQGRARETELHRMFAASRVSGEWFRSTPELEALIGAWPVSV